MGCCRCLYGHDLSLRGAAVLRRADVCQDGAADARRVVGGVKYDTRQQIDLWQLGAEVVVVTRSAADMNVLGLGKGWSPIVPAAGSQVWTDDYSDVLDAMLGRLRG